MFDWIPNLLITLGLGYLILAVVCLILGYGLACMSDKEVPTPSAYDAQEEPQTDDDDVAWRLLNY